MAEPEIIAEEVVEVDTQTTPIESHFDLPAGRGLSYSEAESITRRGLTRVILFAGTADSGKTTLLSSLYLLFHRKPFAGYLFGGCDTFVAFEERNYYVQIACGLSEPKMQRTVVSELLHLRLRREDLSEPLIDVLLCDISGEDFREAKDSMAACQRLGVIRRADTFVLLVDGAKLADPAAQQRAKNDPMTLLRNCLDGEMLSPATTVDVLFTKWDHIEASPSKADIVSFSEWVEDGIVRQFASRVKRLRVKRIAAHPFESNLPFGFGLDHLFPSWVEHTAQSNDRMVTPLVNVAGANEYDRYLYRRLTGATRTDG